MPLIASRCSLGKSSPVLALPSRSSRDTASARPGSTLPTAYPDQAQRKPSSLERVHVFLQVLIQILKHQVEFLLAMYDIQESAKEGQVLQQTCTVLQTCKNTQTSSSCSRL